MKLSPFILTAALLLLPAALRAQPSTTSNESVKDEARRLAEAGQRLFDAGDYKAAIERLEEASARVDAPTISVLCARAHEKLRELVEARALYARVALAALDPGAPRAFVEARTEAAAALARLDAAIPKLVLSPGGAAAALAPELDGATLAEPWRRPILVNPGRHIVVVDGAGRPPERHAITLKEGETRRLTVGAPLPELEAPPSSEPAMTPAAPANSSRSFAAPAIAFSLSAAGAVAGAVTGGFAISRMDSFRQRCGPELACPSSLRGELDGARIAGHASTVSFAVAGVGAAMGAALLLWPAGHAKTRLSVSVGPLGVTATGRF